MDFRVTKGFESEMNGFQAALLQRLFGKVYVKQMGLATQMYCPTLLSMYTVSSVIMLVERSVYFSSVCLCPNKSAACRLALANISLPSDIIIHVKCSRGI